MSQPKQISHISDLRPFYGRFFPFKNVKSGFIRISPTSERKYYGDGIPKGAWMYVPEMLKVFGRVKSSKKLAVMINKQTLDEIRDQSDKAMEQLVFRSLAAEPRERKRAMELLYRLTKASVNGLERVGNLLPNQIQSIAERYSDWPVMLSLN